MAELFDGGKGRPMREWARAPGDRPEAWSSLAAEAYAFVAGPREQTWGKELARMATTEWAALVAENQAALKAIVNGDPGPLKALCSDRDDITIGNPFGGFGRGRAAVFEQMDRGASYYRDLEAATFETVVQSVDPDVAYTVEIERYRAKVGGQDHASDIALRVTCIYRREASGWKLVHRHADPRVERQAAESVIAEPRHPG